MPHLPPEASLSSGGRQRVVNGLGAEAGLDQGHARLADWPKFESDATTEPSLEIAARGAAQ